jgi:dolichol kinase
LSKRKIVKWLLIIMGAAVAIAGSVLFVIWFIPLPELQVSNMFAAGAVICAGLIPLGIGLLMHAKDIRGKRKGLSIFLTVLGWYWLITSALNATVIIVISIVFGDWLRRIS